MAFEHGYVSLEELLDWVRAHPMPDGRFVPVCMWGSRGIGKTQQLKGYTAARSIGLRVMHPAHLTKGSDLVGIPFIDPETRKTTYAMPEALPKTDDPDAAGGGILFIDEINRANLEVMQGMMEVIGEGEIGQSGWKLPPGWLVVAAANPNTAGYDVNKMDDAMIGRMLHYAPGFNAAGWARWAMQERLPHKVMDFVLQNPDLVDSGETNLPPEVNPTLNPRSAAYLASLYEPDMELRVLDIIATGLWGQETAEVLLDHHTDDTRPLTGPQVLAGSWAEMLQYWIQTQRLDLIRASGEYMISVLQPREPVSSRASLAAARWLAAVPQSAFIEAVVSINESAPGWLPIIMAHTETGVAARLPANRSLLRRSSTREISSQRLARSEERRRVEAQQAAQAVLDAQKATMVAQRAPQLQAVVATPAPMHEQPALPPAVVAPKAAVPEAAPAVPAAPSGARKALRPSEGADDDDMPFEMPDVRGFSIPDP